MCQLKAMFGYNNNHTKMITLIIIVILLSVVLAGIIYSFLSRLGKKGLLKEREEQTNNFNAPDFPDI